MQHFAPATYSPGLMNENPSGQRWSHVYSSTTAPYIRLIEGKYPMLMIHVIVRRQNLLAPLTELRRLLGHSSSPVSRKTTSSHLVNKKKWNDCKDAGNHVVQKIYSLCLTTLPCPALPCHGLTPQLLLLIRLPPMFSVSSSPLLPHTPQF